MPWPGAQVLLELDEEGCSRVGSVLKVLPHMTVLVVGQAYSSDFRCYGYSWGQLS